VIGLAYSAAAVQSHRLIAKIMVILSGDQWQQILLLCDLLVMSLEYLVWLYQSHCSTLWDLQQIDNYAHFVVSAFINEDTDQSSTHKQTKYKFVLGVN